MLAYKFICTLSLSLILFGLTACTKEAQPLFKHTDITGAPYTTDFALPDFTGKVRRLQDFKGKVVILFFGYTQCPDVCPTTMAELSLVMKKLGQAANDVQVLFVSLDPERDTPENLAAYVPTFDKRFLGLVGSPEQTKKIAQDFKLFYEKIPGKVPGDYTIDHSAGGYVFDQAGHVRLFVRFNQGPDSIVHDVKLLLGAQRHTG